MTTKLNSNFILILFTIILFWFSTSFADCQKKYDLDKQSKISEIEIDFKNNRKWSKNLGYLLNYYYSKDNKWNINKAKKRYSSKVKVKYASGQTCVFKSSIRFHGDYLDHVLIKNGYPISSMNVKLKEGNINNAVQFILFLPRTRNGDNEIFVTTLLRHLGILAPKTFYTTVKVSGTSVKYLFQEAIKKEFLESNNLIEGPLFEGDENFARADIKRLTRLLNEKWVKDSKRKMLTSLTALSDLNILYLRDPMLDQKEADPISDIFYLDPVFLNNEEKKLFNLYESLMFSLGAMHNLSRNDRRFYFDPIYGRFVPIYYDGMSRILDKKILKKLSADFRKDEKRSVRSLTQNPSITAPAKEGASDAKKLVNKINHKKLLKELNENGLDLSKAELVKIINSIIKRLEVVSEAIVDEKDFTSKQSFYSKYTDDLSYRKNKLVFFNNYDEISNLNYNEFASYRFKICDYSLNKCDNDVTFNNADIKKILNQSYDDLSSNQDAEYSEHIFVGNNYKGYESGNLKRSKAGINYFKKMFVDEDFKIAINDYVKIHIDKEKKIINLEQVDWRGRAVIYKSNVNSWRIIFNNNHSEKNKSEVIPDYQNLTGCLTIIDTFIKNSEIETSNLMCEDSLNFIRSRGDVKKIIINNGFKDGLDADFSNLEFKNININKANNDCIDFSFGNYRINEAKVKNCGDKSVSVGEKSNVNINLIDVSNSKNGVVSKDSSDVFLDKGFFEKVDICLSAYNKKQEFNGGRIKYKDVNCEPSMFFIEKGSQIIEQS